METSTYIKKPIVTRKIGSMISSAEAGYLGEVFVKEKLESLGYKVEHQKHPNPFDLLVNGKYRIEVKSAGWRLVKLKGSSHFSIENNRYNRWDVIMFAVKQLVGEPILLCYLRRDFKKHFGVVKSKGFSNKNRKFYRLAAKTPEEIAAIFKRHDNYLANQAILNIRKSKVYAEVKANENLNR